MLKQVFVLGILAGCLLPVVGCASGDTRPNVLLVVLDTTRRDRLSTYGYPRETSPALDRLASEGLVYEQCISAGSWTLPSHASIFTGLYPRDHHTTVENWTLGKDFTTLAEVLSSNGYATAGFCCNPWISDETGLLQGFRDVEEVWRNRRKDPRDEHGAARTTEAILEWLDARHGAEEPFLIFANYLEPHTPYRPPQPFRDRFLAADADPIAVQEVMAWKTPREFGYMLGVPGMEITDAQFAILDDLYDAEVAYQDSRLGELVDGLRTRGLLDTTLIVVVADHGEQLGEHGMLDHKMTLYEENVRVPLVLRYPPVLAAGLRIRAMVQSNDIFPTVLSLAGIDQPTPAGSRLLPLNDDEEASRPYAFVGMARPTVFMELMEREWPGAGVRKFDRSLRAVRDTRFKFVWASDGERGLFDLQADPTEQVNLSGSLPEVETRLQQALTRFHEEGGS